MRHLTDLRPRGRTLRRTVTRRAPTLTVGLAAFCTVQLWLPTLALAARATGEDTPLDLGTATDAPAGDVGGGSIARVIAGLFVVVAVIYGVTWVLKRMKGAGGPSEGALRTVATVSLHGGGALHLVHVGDEVLLVGAGANGATTLRGWDADEARELGLIDDPSLRPPVGASDGSPTAGRHGRPGGAPNDLAGTVAALGRALRALVDRIRAWTVRG